MDRTTDRNVEWAVQTLCFAGLVAFATIAFIAGTWYAVSFVIGGAS